MTFWRILGDFEYEYYESGISTGWYRGVQGDRWPERNGFTGEERCMDDGDDGSVKITFWQTLGQCEVEIGERGYTGYYRYVGSARVRWSPGCVMQSSRV